MELFDIVDENGLPTGETIERRMAHAEGIRHRTAHIWVVRKKDGKFQALLQKRSGTKDSFPGCFDTSSAGHIKAGDEPLESALRELQEELGIYAKPEDLIPVGKAYFDYEKVFYGNPFKDKEVAFVYIFMQPFDEEKMVLQKEEVEAVQWFDLSEIAKACEPPRNPQFCVPADTFQMVSAYLNNL